MNGLEGDGWWHRYTASQREGLRRYARWRLLASPLASEVEVDRLLASIPDAAREAFAEHCLGGRPGLPPGF